MLVMNKIASFRHAILFSIFKQNSTLRAYSGLHCYYIFVKIRPCMHIRVFTLIRDTYSAYLMN